RSPANRASSASQLSTSTLISRGFDYARPSRPTGRSPATYSGTCCEGAALLDASTGPAEEPLDEGESDLPNANQKLNLDDSRRFTDSRPGSWRTKPPLGVQAYRGRPASTPP